MKKHSLQILLISLAASSLTACGGSSSSDYPPKFIDQQDIPPLNVRKNSVYTDQNQVSFPKYYPEKKPETYNKDVFVFPEPIDDVHY